MKNEIPICVFCYNRLEELELTLESLSRCLTIEDYPIYVFSDGPKNKKDELEVQRVREYIVSVDFLNISHFFSYEINKGLANSVIEGVSKVIKDYGRVIVLEDDLIVSSNFLLYMHSALNFYQSDLKVFSISGYSPKIKIPENNVSDIYFSPRASSWGWATWIDRWETVDWKVKTYSKFKWNLISQWQFAKGGIDLPGMLRDQMTGRINSWAIRWVYQQFLNQQASVYPTVSKVKSIGFGKYATHTKKAKRFETELDSSDKINFYLKSFQGYDNYEIKQFRSVFSIWKRLLDKI